MANPILDQSQDVSGADQYRLTRLYPAPEFVKQASSDQLCGDPATLPMQVYGLAAKRLYPCHTKAATWMSSLFFGENQKKLAPQIAEQVRDRLLKSASYWNIAPDVESLWAKMAADEAGGMERLGNEVFALVWQEEGGRTSRNYPLRNSEEVKAAAAWFNEYHDEFIFRDRQQIATKILARADEFGVGVGDAAQLLQKCAGQGYCSKEYAARAWEKRAQLVVSKQPEIAEATRKLAELVRSATFEARDQGVRLKMAVTMDQFDRDMQLLPYYADGLERPEDVLFGITEKVAGDFLQQHVQTTTGAIYARTELEKLSLDQVTQWMGSDFADAVSAGGMYLDLEKLGELLPTLPRPDAEMFERMTGAARVPVMAREAGFAGMSMPDDERAALAAQYAGR